MAAPTVLAITRPRTRGEMLEERERFAADAVGALTEAMSAPPDQAIVLLAVANVYSSLAESAATAALTADDD